LIGKKKHLESIQLESCILCWHRLRHRPLLEEKEVDLEVDWESDFEPDSSAALVALELVAQRLLCWLVCDVSLAQMTKLIPWKCST